MQAVDITPTLEKLRAQRSAYLQWASNSTEIERLHRQETAFEYYSARQTLHNGDEENRLIAEELNLESAINRLTVSEGVGMRGRIESRRSSGK